MLWCYGVNKICNINPFTCGDVLGEGGADAHCTMVVAVLPRREIGEAGDDVESLVGYEVVPSRHEGDELCVPERVPV